MTGLSRHLNAFCTLLCLSLLTLTPAFIVVMATSTTMKIENNGCWVLLTLYEGQLSETYQVSTHDGWLDVLEYEGLLIRKVRPVEGIVLFDFESGNSGEWTISGLSSSVFTRSKRLDFGQHGDGFIGTGEDGKGGYEETMTGFHWGTGSAMASVEMIHPQYGDVFIHVGRQHGVGVNGCTLSNLIVTPHQVQFTLFSPYDWPTSPVAVIKGAYSPLTVIMNGETIGSFSPQELAKGIKLPFFQD